MAQHVVTSLSIDELVELLASRLAERLEAIWGRPTSRERKRSGAGVTPRSQRRSSATPRSPLEGGARP
jgi:hypothetical protein